MERKCVVCHDNLFSFRCIQCHKPVCEECAFKTENGAFCGRECATNYREFKRSAAAARPAGKGSLVKLVIVLLLILAALAVAYTQGWIPGIGGQ